MKYRASCESLRGFVLIVMIGFLHQAFISDAYDSTQTQDQSSNATTEYDQQSIETTTATQAAADTHMEINSRELKQDAAPIKQSTDQVHQTSSGPYAGRQYGLHEQLGRGPLRRKLSRPNLARLTSAGGGNYQLANYSQPFDAQPASVLYRNRLMAGGEHLLQPAATGRALNSAAPLSAIAESPASYAYISAPSQRVVQQSAPATTTGTAESGAVPSSIMLDEPTSYGQENMLDYTPPLRHAHSAVAPSRVQYYPSPAATTGSFIRHSTAPNGDSLAHFMASPSMNSVGYDDYYPSVGLSDFNQAHGDHYNLARSPFNYYNNTGHDTFGYPHYGSTSPYDNYHHHNSAPSRSRWSWPWTDVSSYGYGSASQDYPAGHQPMTSATFKKHYHHHHHLPSKHTKEHDHHLHHEEHDSLMPKWEHGISIGEIACIAIAVVLGIIILGSPFFLLFLMLFNGGNLFGTTQMGLLAPATVQGGTAAVAGRRRRRKRSLDDTNSLNLSPKDIEAKYREHGVIGVTEYLFQRLSPFLDSSKLLQSFERIMDVKDDIEKIVTKLAKHEASTAAGWADELNQAKSKHQHTEMKRKRKR